jgi:hypothetical protein
MKGSRNKLHTLHIVEMNGKKIGMKTLYLVVIFCNGVGEM